MNNNTYLQQEHVGAFSEWLSNNLSNDTLKHGYVNRRTNTRVEFNSVFAAFNSYHWPFRLDRQIEHNTNTIQNGTTFAHSANALEAIKNALRPAVKEQNNDETLRWTTTLMFWGGVVPGNVVWLRNNQNTLAQTLNTVRQALQGDDDLQGHHELRFNSGMTKIYSLLLDNFVIYDTRVAAALAWAVRKYCQANAVGAVPPCLDFPVGCAKEGANIDPLQRKNRNPSSGSLQFQSLASGRVHARWNMRASWLLTDVLDRCPNDHAFRALNDPLRALESALFMIGYDIPTPMAMQELAYQDSTSFFHLCTRAHGMPFTYTVGINGINIKTHNGRALQVTSDQLVQTLRCLRRDFVNRPDFPLANNVQKAFKNELPAGLGRAMQKAGVQDTTTASYFGPILEDLGLAVWRGRINRQSSWALTDLTVNDHDEWIAIVNAYTDV